MFESHSQIICTVFGVHIYFYGVILAFAIITGTLIADYFGTRFYNLKKETIIDLSPYLIVFGIIGARLYYCLLNHDFYLRFPTEILAIRHGGISIHGAILGGLVGLIIFAKRHKLSIPKLCDVTSIGLILAQSIGRWGNFFNSEAFGTPTNLPWKLFIAEQYRPIPYTNFEYFHPTFLYESILDLLIFFILLLLAKNNKFKKDGNIALIYLILYSIIRIFVEHFRIDSVLYVQGIPIAIIVSASIILLSLVILILRNLLKRVQ
ncbi:MAG: prolipoprotein diacylglyceryl transferase [Cyanobacteria bacterium SIG31]|nr:prolipoprotein diacylglyceryl transferase [Cyanobacteria bacterium SIG31]